MIKKDDFADLEQIRLKHLEDKIIDALIEFDKDKEMQWISIRFEKVLLETLLKAVEKQIPKKPIEDFYHSRYGEDDYDEGYWYNCPTCEFQEVGRYSTEYEDWINRHKCCPECGQLIEW